jgi:hypothetical protein
MSAKAENSETSRNRRRGRRRRRFVASRPDANLSHLVKICFFHQIAMTNLNMSLIAASHDL